MAWKTGDPGVIFLDRINRDNPTPHLGDMESTNPCGEQPLLPYEPCNLGSINLLLMLKQYDSGLRLTGSSLSGWCGRASISLDNVIDMSRYPWTRRPHGQGTRKIGLGVMGSAGPGSSGSAFPMTPKRRSNWVRGSCSS